MSLDSGQVLFDGMKRSKSHFKGFTFTYLYPEPAELRQRIAELEDPLSPAIAELRERISALDASVPPAIVEVRTQAKQTGSLDEMKHFVDCYEKAFAEKTEWERVRRAVDEEGMLDARIDGETDSTASGADAAPSAGDSDSLPGEPAEWGDPSLMKPKYEHAPGEWHREPYIVLS